jgi:deazaflavin-dependent oxidoreductase (nitroreductase family)
MVIVAANSGLPRPPAWYFNLMADRDPSVDVDRRHIRVSALELSGQEAEAFWPRVLEVAPDYARHRKRTSRPLPLIRLIPRSGQ